MQSNINDNNQSNQDEFDFEIIEDSSPLNQSESEDEAQKLQEEKENSRFKDGEKLSMIRVRFPGNARSFPFLVGKRKFAYGQKVVAMSDRGMTVGYINSFPYDVIFNKSMLPLRSIAKIASEEDIRAQIEFRDSEKKAEVICLHLIEKYQLDMVLTHVEFTQFGKKAVFYFNAPARVDFRDLVKDLVYDLKMRIELRQISVRDRAAALGSVGACGLQTCCSSFLKNYGNVSIKMAKNQNLALIPSKLNGVCGQIKCCIKYEDDVYLDKRKNLPREGSFIRTLNGDRGKVQKLNILVEQFEMLTDTGIRRRYFSNQFNPKDGELGNDYRFPEYFENITNETQSVIGLNKEEQTISDKFIDAKIISTNEKFIDETDINKIKNNKDIQELDFDKEDSLNNKSNADHRVHNKDQHQQNHRNQNNRSGGHGFKNANQQKSHSSSHHQHPHKKK